jgi:hypothetical protein
MSAARLICYTNSPVEAARHMGAYAGRILKGDKPVDLPVTGSNW